MNRRIAVVVALVVMFAGLAYAWHAHTARIAEERRVAEEYQRTVRAAEEKRAAEAKAAENAALRSAVALFVKIDSGLDVGTNYNEFTGQVKEAKLGLESLEAQKFTYESEQKTKITDCLNSALRDYLDSHAVWGDIVDVGKTVRRKMGHKHFWDHAQENQLSEESEDILERLELTNVDFGVNYDREVYFSVNLESARQKLWSDASAKVKAANLMLTDKTATMPTVSSPEAAEELAPYKGKDAAKVGKVAGAEVASDLLETKLRIYNDEWSPTKVTDLVNAVMMQKDVVEILRSQSEQFRQGFRAGLDSGLRSKLAMEKPHLNEPESWKASVQGDPFTRGWQSTPPAPRAGVIPGGPAYPTK